MGIQRTYKPTELHILISVNKARMSGLLVPSYRTGFGFDTIAHDRRAFELSQKAFRWGGYRLSHTTGNQNTTGDTGK